MFYYDHLFLFIQLFFLESQNLTFKCWYHDRKLLGTTG